jgi:hypothetical protein
METSTIDGAGRGLRCDSGCIRLDILTEYCGVICDWDAFINSGRDPSHARGLNWGYTIIDGYRTYPPPADCRGLGSYINDSLDDPSKINVVFHKVYDKASATYRIFIKAIMDIPPGGETFISYGKTYWQTSKDPDTVHDSEGKSMDVEVPKKVNK